MQLRLTHRSLLFLVLAVSIGLGPATSQGTRPTQPAADHSLYLPVVQRSYPAIQLHGHVTEQGVAAAGVRVDLLYSYAGCKPQWYPSNILRTVTTDSNGIYNFTDVPTLKAQGTHEDPCYMTVYFNTDHDPQRLAFWLNSDIRVYTLGSTVNAGNFDIADVARISPADSARFPQYVDAQMVTLHFKWIARPGVPTDTYYLQLSDATNGLPLSAPAYSSPALGFVGAYTQTFRLCFDGCSLSDPSGPGLRFNGTYTWQIAVSHGNTNTPSNNGFGVTFQRSFSVPVRR